MADLINPTATYLKAVLECDESGIAVYRATLTKRLNQAASTVSQTVNRMESEGLFLALPEDRQIYLSQAGRRAALNIMRKHRLAEVFLVNVIELELALVHNEASAWEHAMSDMVTDRLDSILAHPKSSPFGNHIPTSQEVTTGRWTNPITGERLNALRYSFDHDADTPATVHSLGEPLQENVDMMRRMEAVGLLPGAQVLVERSRSAIEVSVVGQQRSPLEFDLLDASNIFVLDTPSL